MACFSVGCSHGYFIARDNLGFYGGKTMTLGRYGGFFCSSFPFPSRGHYKFYKSQKGLLRKGKFRSLVSEKDGVSPLGFYSCCKSQSGLSFNNEIKPLRSGNNGDRPVYAVNRKNSDKVRRRLSLRLRPRLRLLTIKLRRLSVRSMLDDVGTFVRKNIRRVTFSAAISVALGLCYLFLKVTALPSPKMVPYSDLIMSLQNGSVTKVLIEEGSRRIYYNTNLQSVGNVQMSDKESSAMSAPSENVVDKVASDGSMSVQSPNVNVLKKISRTRASVPVWQYSARKIDHDEKFLLSLMREKGTTYSSAPQSVMMSIRSTLITVLTLWIPLIPLMWLLYRQLSAANSPARKRRPDNEIVGFDDVEGVDAAKVELMEVSTSSLAAAYNIWNILLQLFYKYVMSFL